LPMAMLVLSRSEGAGGWGRGTGTLFVWVFVALAVGLDQAQQHAGAQPHGRRRDSRRARFAGYAAVAGVLALAYAACGPFERLAVLVQRGLFGMSAGTHSSWDAHRNVDLALTRALPQGFAGRTRAVLLIRAGSAPVYLRESVYTTYSGGRWVAEHPKPSAHASVVVPETEGDVRPCVLAPGAEHTVTDVWRVEVLAPSALAGLSVPGNAVMVQCEGWTPHADTNGMVAVVDFLPRHYQVDVAACPAGGCAYPLPDGAADPAYLEIPPIVAGAVSNWVESCAGLREAPTARQAAACVERYLGSNFTYRADVRLRANPDPLLDFARRREGFCVHFASAAALILRARGLPTRVVGGYACGEWNPWIGQWVVRERSGHAWAEVWDAAERRWLLVEATPADGRPTADVAPGVGRLALDWVVSIWRRVVFWLGHANILGVVASAGMALVLLLWRVIWSPAGPLLLLLAGLIWLRFRRRLAHRQQTSEEQLRATLIDTMERVARQAVPDALRRRASESWADWLTRVEPALPQDTFSELRERVGDYQRLRYQVQLDQPAAHGWLARIR